MMVDICFLRPTCRSKLASSITKSSKELDPELPLQQLTAFDLIRTTRPCVIRIPSHGASGQRSLLGALTAYRVDNMSPSSRPKHEAVDTSVARLSPKIVPAEGVNSTWQ